MRTFLFCKISSRSFCCASFSVYLGWFLDKPSFLSAWLRQDVECHWSGGRIPSEWRGRGWEWGWIPSLGYSGKEEVTFLLACIMGWQAQWRSGWGGACSGAVGSFTPIITFTAAGDGLSGRTRGKTLPWCTLLKHAGLGVEWGQWGGSCWM